MGAIHFTDTRNLIGSFSRGHFYCQIVLFEMDSYQKLKDGVYLSDGTKEL